MSSQRPAHPFFTLILAAAFVAALLSVRSLLESEQAAIPMSQDQNAPHSTYLGFDRNEYPGDQSLATLRSTFAYAGFWLNNPPGASQNTWTGKRAALLSHGFGFLVLFNGRLDAELKHAPDISVLARSDGASAVESARRQGFSPGTIIFLDIEEGGRMLAEQKNYIYTWADTVNTAGFRAGVYCSGIPVPEGAGARITTAEDLYKNAGGRPIVFWVANDACPPSPGCAFPRNPPAPSQSGVPFADVWQYAQSPRRREFARRCAQTYSADGNCYPPRNQTAQLPFLDIDVALEPDPSHGRRSNAQ